MSLETAKLDSDNASLAHVRPGGSYRLFRRYGEIIYLSGQGPMKPDGSFHVGKVGAGVGLPEAYEHARLVGRLMLSTLAEAGFILGRLEVVKLLGMVNAAHDFRDHSAVIDGCSDLLIDMLGSRGEHARSAVGVGSLPHNMTLEVEAIFRLCA